MDILYKILIEPFVLMGRQRDPGHVGEVGRGQKLWRGGNPASGMPACAGCHGPTGAGMPAQYPRPDVVCISLPISQYPAMGAMKESQSSH